MFFAMGLLVGTLLGSSVFFVLGMLYGKRGLKTAVADAETRGIHSGTVLEAEAGWTKKRSKKR